MFQVEFDYTTIDLSFCNCMNENIFTFVLGTDEWGFLKGYRCMVIVWISDRRRR